MAAVEIFRALGDPIRLQMVQRLTRQPCTISAVSEGLGITRQGARKHLLVLEEAELVRLEPSGRDTLVHLEPASLDAARRYIGELEQTWARRLEALKQFVESAD